MPATDAPSPAATDAGPPHDSEEWVTVMTAWDPAFAHIAAAKLASEEIETRLLDEQFVGTYWLYANAVGGAKLQVPAADAARARDVLEHPPAPPLAPAPDAAADPHPDAAAACPRCRSTDTARTRRSGRLFGLSMLVLGLLPFRVTHCHACGHEWR